MKPLALYRQGLFYDASPHMRGKCSELNFLVVCNGLTHTCAGKTPDKA